MWKRDSPGTGPRAKTRANELRMQELHISAERREKPFWAGDVTQLSGKWIWELMSSMSPKFTRLRLGHSKRGPNNAHRASMGWPMTLWVRKYPIPKDSLTHQAIWAKWLTLLNTDANLSSWPVTLSCRTGNLIPIPDKHTLRRTETWALFFAYSSWSSSRLCGVWVHQCA